MAEIRSFPFFRHVRADASSFVLHYRGTRLRHSGRGLAFWFRPLKDSVAEIPADDRELTLVIHGRSADFQDVSVQGLVTYRVLDPAKLAERVDFTVDPRTGVFLRQPLEKIAQFVSQLAQQHAADFIARAPVRQILTENQARIRSLVEEGLAKDVQLAAMGLGILGVRITSVKPCPDLEKALEAPMREKIKQDADEATFGRRAMAVEKERAIQENELQNRIELAKREELLIGQQGQNERRKALEDVEAQHITLAEEVRAQALRAEAAAKAERMRFEAEAEGIRAVEGAKVEAERLRLEAQAKLPTGIMVGLALRELAGKLQRIDHLNLGPDLLGPAFVNLLEAGTRELESRRGGE